MVNNQPIIQEPQRIPSSEYKEKINLAHDH
jgi:hypothetical protein